MNLAIRSEKDADIATIDTITIDAFQDAAHTSHTEQFIIKALRAAGALSVSLVAELGGAVIGHVAASPVRVIDRTGSGEEAVGWFGIGPLSVLPAYRCNGVGSRLMREVLDVLRARGAAGCVLLGEPAYYRRFGFEVEPGLILPDVPPEYFQALSFGGVLPRGEVTYHAAFIAQD